MMRFRIECCLLPVMENMFVTLLVQLVLARTTGLPYGIPKVHKGIRIPVGLLETRDSLDASLDAIDIDIIWANSYYWTIFHMCIVYRLVFGASISFPKNP